MRKQIALVVAGLTAIILALGWVGTANASQSTYPWDSADIKNNSLKSWDLAPNSVGNSEMQGNAIGSPEVAYNSLIGWDIKNGSLTGVDIKDGSLGLKELSASAVAELKGGSGDKGDQGDKGDTGADGAPGLANVRADEPYTQVALANSVTAVFGTCPEGKAAISGGYRLNGWAAEAFQGGGSAVPDITVIASEPAGVVDGALVNTYLHESFPQDESGAFLPNAWAVTLHNAGDTDQQVRVAVVCATVTE